MFKRQHRWFADTLERRLGSVAASGILFVLEILQILIVSLVIIWPVRTYLIKPFVVRGASMEPNFYDHEYLVIDELSYRLHDPRRGEIVVFHYPKDESQFFIKRVIGLPGETVEVSAGEVRIYNAEYPEPLGRTLDETYLGDVETLGTVRRPLGPDEYFVMGDNRSYSLDSRSFGAVRRDEIVGRVWLRGFPFNRIGGFELPDYHF